MADPRTKPLTPERSRILAKGFFGMVLLWRLLYLIPFTSIFDSVGDESYYWDWGRKLDWGYFSKPPMIGWLMGIVGRLSGNSEWGIRLAALLLGSLSLWLLYKLADRLYGPRTALYALLLGALTPANSGLNLLLTIDAPLVLCWTWALLVFWHLVEKPDSRGRWLLLTVILGLGHLSKQMMLVFPLLMILFCRFNPQARPLLRRRAFWWSIGASILFLTPVVIWNANHGWVTLLHTGTHFQAKADATLLDRVGNFFGFYGLQAVIFTPLTWVLMVAVSFGGWRQWRVLDLRERYLVLFSAPALAVFVLLSLRQNINANWPAVFYLGAVVLTAAWMDRSALSAFPWERLRGWVRPALWTALVFTLAVYLVPLAIQFTPLAGSKYDPAFRLRGWQEMGRQAQAYLDKVPHPDRTFVVALGERQVASELAFYMPSHPQVFRYRAADQIESQYEIWPDPGDMGYIGGDALIFRPKDDIPLAPSLLSGFLREITKIGELHSSLGQSGDERFCQVYLAPEMKLWPAPPTAAEVAQLQERMKIQQEKEQAKGGAGK